MTLNKEFAEAQENVLGEADLADAITAAKVIQKANLGNSSDILNKILVGPPCSGKTTAALEYIQDMI